MLVDILKIVWEWIWNYWVCFADSFLVIPPTNLALLIVKGFYYRNVAPEWCLDFPFSRADIGNLRL